jgi:hypothetical protein
MTAQDTGSSLANLGRSNRQASNGRTHGWIAVSGLGMHAISRYRRSEGDVSGTRALATSEAIDGPHSGYIAIE